MKLLDNYYSLFNTNPSGGYAAGKFMRSLKAQHFQTVRADLLIDWLLSYLDQTFVAAVPFTLLNVTSHQYNMSVGHLASIPDKVIYGDSCLSFTFALSNSYNYGPDITVRFANGPLRTWSNKGESRVQFVTITLTRNQARKFNLKSHFDVVLDDLWLWVGSATKNHYMHANKSDPNVELRTLHTVFYNLPAINMIKSWPRSTWQYNKNFWSTPVITQLDDAGLFYALCYHDIYRLRNHPDIVDQAQAFVKDGLLSLAQKINGVVEEERLCDLAVPLLVSSLLAGAKPVPVSNAKLKVVSDEVASRLSAEAIPLLTDTFAPKKLISRDLDFADDLWQFYDTGDSGEL